MNIDEDIVRRVLKEYNMTLEDIFDLAKKKPKAEQDWIYLIHHMHPNENNPVKIEDLHHCDMFEKKNLGGKKWDQIHVEDKKVILHALNIPEDKLDTSPDVVYDHLNNEFKVKIREVGGKKYAIIEGPVSMKDIKWSDQDK